MNIDDLLCVGAVDNILVSSTIGRNKLLIPGEVKMCIRDSSSYSYINETSPYDTSIRVSVEEINGILKIRIYQNQKGSFLKYKRASYYLY